MRADLLLGVAALAWAAVVLFSLKNPASLDDGLRHFAYAKASLGGGWSQGWSRFLYEGYLSGLKTDPWFLADVLMTPFSLLPIATGIKLFTLAELAAVIAASLLFLRSLRLTPASRTLLLAVLLFGHPQWLGRTLIGRPFPLITVAAILTLWAILERRHVALAVVLGASVLLSQLFVFPLCIAVCGVLWRLSLRDARGAGQMTAAAAVGVVTGLLLHPHPIEYLRYMVTAFVRIPFLGDIGLSAEMSGGLGDLWAANVAVVAAAVGLIAVAAVARHRVSPRMMHAKGITLITTLCLGLLCAYLLWVRAIDVLWPMLTLLLATVYALHPSLAADSKAVARSSRAARILTVIMVLMLPLQALSVSMTFWRVDAEKSLDAFSAVDTLPPGSRVLNADWQTFFGFVARRPDLHYATGIDPSFTYITDPDVHALLQDLRKPAPAANALETIRALLVAYPSDYIALSRAVHASAIQTAMSMPDLQPVVVTGPYAVFKVR